MMTLLNRSLALALAGTGLLACSGSRVEPTLDPRSLPREGTAPPDVSQLYRQLGLIAGPAPLSFVGKVSYFAANAPDTTIVLASVSIPNRALTFTREGDRYRAPYEVKLTLRRGEVEAATINAMEIVRVGTFREINRTDESVIFQHFFRVPPGSYSMALMVRDVGGSRTGNQTGEIVVPSFRGPSLSTPMLVYEAKGRSNLDSVPRLLGSPRSSAVFGRDSTIAIYIEGYGPGSKLPVRFSVRNDQGVTIWRDSSALSRNGSLFTGVVNVPISSVGVGIANVLFTRSDWQDTVRAPLFVTFGEDIPLMSFEDMLGYLRYFASSSRLKTLRDAPSERRASVWAEFLRATDPIPETSINEDMQGYFNRIQQANVQFRMDRNPGWLSDRGMVFVALGEPDQILERSVNQTLSVSQASTAARLQVWQYRQYNSQLTFYEETGRWKLTRPSESEFSLLNARRWAR